MTFHLWTAIFFFTIFLFTKVSYRHTRSCTSANCRIAATILLRSSCRITAMSWKPGTVTKRRKGKARPAPSDPAPTAAPPPHTPAAQQATTQHTPRGRSVAVIGGGISGLSCAVRLAELGYSPTVFDTGRKAVGGRCSSRREQDTGRSSLSNRESAREH